MDRARFLDRSHADPDVLAQGLMSTPVAPSRQTGTPRRLSPLSRGLTRLPVSPPVHPLLRPFAGAGWCTW
ncbi:hypothetical protein NOCARDAX2BIS_190050 [Nocardioides sp. AX2bis]|nr:hypothetical protein NOCARDAX2BIS_190050 [Nocardioides sp. AX2bis]